MCYNIKVSANLLLVAFEICSLLVSYIGVLLAKIVGFFVVDVPNSDVKVMQATDAAASSRCDRHAINMRLGTEISHPPLVYADFVRTAQTKASLQFVSVNS